MTLTTVHRDDRPVVLREAGKPRGVLGGWAVEWRFVHLCLLHGGRDACGGGHRVMSPPPTHTVSGNVAGEGHSESPPVAQDRAAITRSEVLKCVMRAGSPLSSETSCPLGILVLGLTTGVRRLYPAPLAQADLYLLAILLPQLPKCWGTICLLHLLSPPSGQQSHVTAWGKGMGKTDSGGHPSPLEVTQEEAWEG